MKPLAGLVVLDFAQFLAGPSAALRLADLGARVIKIERPGKGEAGRHLHISEVRPEGDSLLFHTINRNKESYAANLKDPGELDKVKQLVKRADVLVENFRPGVMEKLGLDYDTLSKDNPRLVYGTITGYGPDGPWKTKPGQDLLAQSVSGLAWLNGDAGQPPTPMGLAQADMLAGAHLVQGILAALVRRGSTGRGARVQVSLLESALDFQFEVLTTYLNDGGQLPRRSAVHNAHAYLGAPYGIYATRDGYLALAMGSVAVLAELLQCPPLQPYSDRNDAFTKRDEIKSVLVEHLATRTTREWLDRLEPADVWCSEVLDWDQLTAHEGYRVLDMEQEVHTAAGTTVRTLRCPIRIDGEVLKSGRGAPAVGQDNAVIEGELL